VSAKEIPSCAGKRFFEGILHFFMSPSNLFEISTLAIIFSVVFLSGMQSFADTGENYRFYVPRRNEEMYGTWVNENHDGVKRFQKAVYYYWGY
jgi:hypothetical protein